MRLSAEAIKIPLKKKKAPKSQKSRHFKELNIKKQSQRKEKLTERYLIHKLKIISNQISAIKSVRFEQTRAQFEE